MKPRPRSDFPEKLENVYVFKEHFHADCFESPRILWRKKYLHISPQVVN